MYKNVLNEAEEVKENGFKLKSNGDIIRVKGLYNVNLECYDSDGNHVGKALVI